jgi:hypothetical protein
MAIPLTKYAKIKNNYCVGYLGDNPELLLQLKVVRPFIEKELPGIKIFVACQDRLVHVLEGEERIILESELSDKISECAFAYYRELDRNDPHSVKIFLNESNIPYSSEVFNL